MELELFWKFERVVFLNGVQSKKDAWNKNIFLQTTHFHFLIEKLQFKALGSFRINALYVT